MIENSNYPEAIHLIVFDWDGTLMDSETQIVNAIHATISDLQLELRSVEECRNIIGLGLREAIEALYPGQNESFRNEFVNRYRHHWFGGDSHSELFPGTRETLELLKESGFLLAVATGKGRPGLNKALGETDLDDIFAATRCADETRSKPHPRMLNEILQELDVAADQVLMVGDTEYDMIMAREAGVGPVAVSYGVHERDRLMQHQPLVCLDRITELVDCLAEAGLMEPGRTVDKSLAIANER
jgi:phosphoglycolate phosphatase